jgi:hypothetical protein
MLAAALRHPISVLGVAVTTASALLFLGLFALHILGFIENPYVGILVFIVIPAIFVVGLLLIPVGRWLNRRRQRAGLPVAGWPRIDLNDATQRRMIALFMVATIANILLLSMASYGAVQYTDSTPFCGQVCHSVMEPEFVAHAAGPHAQIECARCHVGPGAGGFVTAKLNGTRQLWLVTTGKYSRPIPEPIGALPAVEGTCERCHRADHFIGDTLAVVYDYASNAANTQTITNLRLHVGGPAAGTGIHGMHANGATSIEYAAADDKREQIPYVRMTMADGRVREFFADGVNRAEAAARPLHRMDCLDCHNRPAHAFGATPQRAVDTALGRSLVNAKIPYIRREMVRVLRASYPTQETGLQTIDRDLRMAVTVSPQAAFTEADLRRAIAVTQGIYRDNVFPGMKVGWGTYPNHLGHTDAPGCFRCHDDSHKSSDGMAISQDCELCHAIE